MSDPLGAANPVVTKFNDHLLPTTFVERGATVPFTTPILAHARVRKDWRGRVELVIAGFVGNAAKYVVPWPVAADLVSMTAHDRLLHQAMPANEALDPESVRLAALEVARTGLAGPDVAEAAHRALAVEDQARTLNRLALLVRVIETVEQELGEELAREIGTPEGQARIRETFRSLGDKVSLDPEAFEQRLAELSALSYSVGTADSPSPGRVRRLLAQLDEFRTSIACWGAQRLGVTAEQAQHCAAVATQTLGIGAAVLAEFDDIMDSPGETVADWEIKAQAVGPLAQRLAWLVDGWEPIAAVWLAAGSDNEQVKALGEIVPILPFLPRNEARLDEQREALMALASKGRGWVRTSEDWRTGEPDPELVQRLEMIKAKMT